MNETLIPTDYNCPNSEAWFQCKKSHVCLTREWVCDGEYDCDDESGTASIMAFFMCSMLTDLLTWNT